MTEQPQQSGAPQDPRERPVDPAVEGDTSPDSGDWQGDVVHTPDRAAEQPGADYGDADGQT